MYFHHNGKKVFGPNHRLPTMAPMMVATKMASQLISTLRA